MVVKCSTCCQVLSDGQKRANYDAYGHSTAGSYGSSTAQGDGFTANHAEEIFRQFFGQGFSGGFDFDGFQQSSGGQNTIHQVRKVYSCCCCFVVVVCPCMASYFVNIQYYTFYSSLDRAVSERAAVSGGHF